jgi:hypothetical protein
LKWLSQKNIPEEIFENFLLRVGHVPLPNTCNTLKKTTTSCEIKCKIRGIIVAMSNCGIIISFREIFGSESLSQVTMLYLDTLELFQGKCRF